MGSPNGSSYSAFQDKVTFHIPAFVSYKSRIAIDAVVDVMLEAYPDYETMSGTLKSALNIFMLCVAETTALDFDLADDDHPALHNLQAFWVEYQHSDDYPAVFERFLELVDVDAGNTWWTAREACRLSSLHAPPELQVKAVDLPDELKKSEKPE